MKGESATALQIGNNLVLAIISNLDEVDDFVVEHFLGGEEEAVLLFEL